MPGPRARGGPATDTTPARQGEIDGLRCVAALSVLAFHVWLFSAPQPRFARRDALLDHVLGELRIGLYLFFVLSGYLLYGAWARAAARGGEDAPRPGRYLARRAARILPAYYVALAGSVLALYPARGTPGLVLPDAGHAWLFAILGQNFSQHTLLTLNSPTWTLAVEAAFYLLLVALGWLALRAGRAHLAVPLGVIAVGLAYNLLLATGSPSLGLRLALPALLPHFGAGMLVAAVLAGRDGEPLSSRAGRALAAGGVALVVADAAWHELSGGGLALRALRDVPAGAGFALVVAAVAGAGTGARWLGRRPIAFAGLVSYGIYLWHVPLILALRSHGLLPEAWPVALAVALPLALAAGAASWRYVEAPALGACRQSSRSRMRPIRGCGSPHKFSAMQPALPSNLRGAHNHGWTTPTIENFPDRLLERVPWRRLVARVDVVLVAILAAALALRLRNIGHGLPIVFDVDENLHFVRPAIGMFGDVGHPHYFQNPSALTDLLNALYRLGFRQGLPFGESGLLKSFRADPTTAFLAARVAVAVLGTLAVALVYGLGRRAFDRRTGLVAAAILAFAFLPYRYSVVALTDVPAVAAAAAATIAALAAWERGSARAFALAGAAVGLAVAFKYLAAPLLGVVVLAALLRLANGTFTRGQAGRAAAISGAAAAGVFVVLNPYAVLDFGQFSRELAAQARVDGVLGQEDRSGPAYYAWTLTWGLGWIPLAAAAGGLVLLVRRDPRRALLLSLFPLALFAIVALGHPRFYGRYLLGAYPVLCVLAGYGLTRLLDALAPRVHGARAGALGGAGALLLCGQGLADTVRVSATLGRDDTRALAARWVTATVPEGSGIVLEPLFPGRLVDVRRPGVAGRYRRFATPVPPGTTGGYTRFLKAELVARYRDAGFCWVVVSSHQRMRALAAGLPGARAYYARLSAASTDRATFSPYRAGAPAVRFGYDASFDVRSRSFARPGPVVDVYRLRDCAGPPR